MNSSFTLAQAATLLQLHIIPYFDVNGRVLFSENGLKTKGVYSEHIFKISIFFWGAMKTSIE